VTVPDLLHESVIDAPPERVWDVFADFASWDRWNPTLSKCSGPPVPGTEVRMKLRLGPLSIPMRQEIRDVDPPRRLVWRSRQMVPPTFLDVIRRFEIEPLEGNRSRFVQSEGTTGYLAALEVRLLGKGIIQGYENLARELAKQVAAGAA
jgi:hypothetical protein